MKNFLFQFKLLPSNTVIWKKCFIRKDVNWEIWGLECRKVLSITAYVAGIVRATQLGKGLLNHMTQFWMEKEVKIKKRVTKTVTLSMSSKTRNLGGRCLLFRANDTPEVRQIIPLNNWNVNFKETEMPPKWGLHIFQHGTSDSNVQRWQQRLPRLTTVAIYTLHLLGRSKNATNSQA